MGGKKRIRVKFVNRAQLSSAPIQWLRQFPNRKPVWGNCEFIFDPNEPNYDWFVAENDLPAPAGKSQAFATETLRCPAEHTLFMTREPSSVTIYGSPFLAQFAHVLTAQEDWAIKHPGKIHSQPALRWYYGDTTRNNARDLRDYDHIVQQIPDKKTKTIATVCSIKAQKHTMHYDRLQFIERLQRTIPEMDRFGEGFREIPDKAASLDAYKYHIAIENHVAPHWWTEKLADAFLGHTLPFYHGAPNASDYFPADSFIPINIYNFDESLHIIRNAIAEGAYEKRIGAIKGARKQIVEKYNTFASVAAIIESRHDSSRPSVTNLMICGKHALRRNPLIASQIAIEKVAGRVRAWRRSKKCRS